MAKASAAWKQPINGRCIPMGNPPSIWTMSGIYRKWKPPSAAHVPAWEFLLASRIWMNISGWEGKNMRMYFLPSRRRGK